MLEKETFGRFGSPRHRLGSSLGATPLSPPRRPEDGMAASIAIVATAIATTTALAKAAATIADQHGTPPETPKSHPNSSLGRTTNNPLQRSAKLSPLELFGGESLGSTSPFKDTGFGIKSLTIRTRRQIEEVKGEVSQGETPALASSQVFTPNALGSCVPTGTLKGIASPNQDVPEAYFSPVVSELRRVELGNNMIPDFPFRDGVVKTPSEASGLSPPSMASEWQRDGLLDGGLELNAATAWSGLSNIAIIKQPLPMDIAVIRCYIVRDKSSSAGTLFTLYTEEGEGRADRPLLFARETRRKGRVEYVLAMHLDGTKTQQIEDGLQGTVRANYMGTKFSIYDKGNDKVMDDQNLMGTVTFHTSVTSLAGDWRRMTVKLPRPSEASPTTTEAVSDVWNAESKTGSLTLTSRAPFERKVNGMLQHYLPFHGRCKLPSVKNFQLCLEDQPDAVVLLFGKMSSDTYCMDFSWPLCAHQAFGISLASVASKLCYAV